MVGDHAEYRVGRLGGPAAHLLGTYGVCVIHGCLCAGVEGFVVHAWIIGRQRLGLVCCVIEE